MWLNRSTDHFHVRIAPRLIRWFYRRLFRRFEWDDCDCQVARMRRLADRRRISEPMNLVKSAELIALEQNLDTMT